MTNSRAKLKSFLEWDELAWSECLELFADIIKKQDITHGIELAANKGGISLYFANELGVKMLCTDLKNPEKKCAETIALLKKKDMISFDAIDALAMNLPDNSVDMLVFKSFLGVLHTYEKQQQAMHEMHRVLKPGGVLLFAENLQGSAMHRFIRKKKVRWGSKWRYLRISELDDLLVDFKIKEIKSFGYFSAFAKIEFLRPGFYYLDKILDFLIPASSKYIGYGFAIK